jgi:predicted type IV restriction endonuclease
MTIPQPILDLIRRFNDNAAQYRSLAYNETEARREFIDPLFKALGWDVDNTQGYSEKYKEVVHEARVTVGGRVKAPDYAFRMGGRPVFFVEAKRPGVTLHAGREADEAAFQVRRYAWSAKLPVSVLTNFAEFALYDCRSKPARSEGAGIGRVAYYTHTQFPDVWDDLSSLLAPEAIRKGALDRFIASEKATRGTLAVDAAFLAEIEGWRDTLARNIALRNSGLTVRDLNFAVQKTIDRLIFLRIAEDRGFEPYHRLGDLAQGKDVYRALGEVFRQADNRYNAGLFYFRQETDRDADYDDFTLDLQVDDKTLKDILTRLYYPESPYAFDALPADILGQVYEQFLGKVIRLTAGGRAKVEEKPEVKKAGGVYYTPTYIVDYIVEHTIGTLLEGKTWREVRGLDARGVQRYAPLRCLDPACGSGTFLLQAYQYLLDWYLEQYTADDSAAHAKAGRIARPVSAPLSPPPGGTKGGEEWRLTTEARKDILLTHLYGVDIDPQAVEVTKLSLLLKVLEGEDEATLGQQLTMSLGKAERVLPDLGQNIRCGNSLIGSDFYQGQQLGLGLLDEEEVYRINAFDWDTGFGKAMAAGGFDAVIGNPPYIRIQAMKEYAPQEVEFYKKQYVAASKGNYDIYVVFVEKGLSLLRSGGRLGYILPHKFFNAHYGEPLRGLIAQGKHLADVVHFGDQQVFTNATTYTCLLFLDKDGRDTFHVAKVDDLAAWRAEKVATKGEMQADEINTGEWNLVVGSGAQLYRKLQEMPVTLEQVAEKISQGIRTSANEIYVLDLVSIQDNTIVAHSKELDKDVTIEKDLVSSFLLGREIKPYQLLSSGKVVIIPYRAQASLSVLIAEQEFRQRYPLTYSYLRDNKGYLENRERGRMRGPEWYGYVYPKNIELMSSAKILIPDIANRASFALDEKGEYAFTSGYGITLKDSTRESIKYILGLLNSKILDFYLKRISTTLRGGFFRYFTQYVERLPIRTIDFDDPADVARHDRMVALVERMLDLHRRFAAAKLAHEKHLLQQQIDVTDKAIDTLVYELYALTPEEIAIVGEV